MKFSKYFLAALGSFLLWGFFSLALKPLQDYASLDILFYRVFFCAAIMAVISLGIRRKVLKDNWAIFQQRLPSEKRKTVFLTLLGGSLLIANWFFFIYVMNHVSVNAASFAYLVCPIMTTVVAYFLLHEKLTKLQWFAVLLSVISCVLLSMHDAGHIWYSLIVASSYSFYLVSQRNNTGFDRFLILSIQIIFVALLLIPFYPIYSESIPTEFSFYALITVIAIVFTIIPLFMNLYALQGVNSSTMGILLYLNPLVTFVVAICYFKETIDLFQMIAYSLILLSIFIFNINQIFAKNSKAALE